MLKVCAVYDSAVEAYGNPIFVPALGAATRSFHDEVNRKDSVMNGHAGDYNLYHIGNYDPSSGLLIPCDPPKLLAKGIDSLVE